MSAIEDLKAPIQQAIELCTLVSNSKLKLYTAIKDGIAAYIFNWFGWWY